MGSIECLVEQLQQPQPVVSGAAAPDDALGPLTSSFATAMAYLGVSVARRYPPEPSAPAAPLGERSTPQVVGPPHPSRAVGSRSLLVGGPALVTELDGEEEQSGREMPIQLVKRIDSREQRLAALTAAARKREYTLPPPLSASVLPPALPPLPLPLSVLRQRMGANAGSQAPSLPPPVPMGEQCSPERHTTCGCEGGSCECDLYPDYLPRTAPSSPSRQARTSPDDDDQRTVVPPLRRLQFFNSNFKSNARSPPSSTPAWHPMKRGRALKERRTVPSLRVLCYCRCPSRDDPFG